MGFWKIPTCQWDGRYTLMVPSDNFAFIDLQPTRARRHVGGIRHERDSVEINNRAPQWSHDAVWNRKYMEPKPRYTLRQLWADSEPAIGHKSSPTYEVKESDIRRAVAAFADLPSSTLPDSPSSSRWGRQQQKRPTTNWHLGTESPGGMGVHLV